MRKASAFFLNGRPSHEGADPCNARAASRRPRRASVVQPQLVPRLARRRPETGGASGGGELAFRIRKIFEKSKGRYGAPRIQAELVAQGLRVDRKTMAKIMREHDVRPPRRRRVPRTTDRRYSLGLAPNQPKRNVHADAPCRIWLADISYIPTDQGWLYYAAERHGNHGDRRLGDVIKLEQGPGDRSRAHRMALQN